MDRARLRQIQDIFDFPRYRIDQLAEAFFCRHVSDYAGVTTLAKALRTALGERLPALTVQPVQVQTSADGRARKALLALGDGACVETVLLQPKPGLWSCCISTQVGCRFGCGFCATGAGGYRRDLAAEEMTDQVLFWRQYLARELPGETLRNVVYMGMGEPFDNLDAVMASLDELTCAATFDIGARRLSVSTVGLEAGIRELTRRFPQVNLAISLHAPTDRQREALMPAGKRCSLAAIRRAVGAHTESTHRKVFLEYLLLRGVNDSDRDVTALAAFVGSFRRPELLHVNLIAYNQTPAEGHYASPSRQRVVGVRDRLAELGVHVTIRRSLGRDIAGACGQLAATAASQAG